ncbi:MAG: hypothetical protein MJ170_03485 [Alphaproteobacteria bacterium]|nr:hypothetical protein [Alphaproteobacteria bacterium]
MADVSFKNFILDWYKAYHLGQMDEPRKARWEELRGKSYEDTPKEKRIWLDDKRTGKQKGWDDGKGNLKTTLPEPELSDEDWEKFYTICRDTIRSINANREDLRRAAPDAPFPIEKWFATNDSEVPYKPFSSQEIDAQQKETFKKLAALITKSVDLQQLLSSNFNDDYSFGTFLKDLQSGDYSKHPKQVIEKLRTTLWVLRSNLNLNFQLKLDNIRGETVKELVNIFGLTTKDNLADQCETLQNHLDELIAAIDPENEKINPQQLAQFKDPSVYAEILKALYATDKEGKKSAFYKHFESYGGSQITRWMSESVDGNNYETGDNALTPKLEDERDLKETISKKVSDFKDEHFKRFTDRAARHIYVEPKAKAVVDAICKEKISPKDGLAKILEKKDAILKRVQTKEPTAKKGAEFLFEALEYIKNSGDMDKAFEGALRNGRKAEAIAFEIMKYAMTKGKVAEAKVALETFAVMRYDTFTSAHWDKVKEANKNFSLFGDKELSWNKRISFVTAALDKTLGLGINAIFWAGVITRNTIQHARGKITKKDHFRLSKTLVELNKKAAEFKDLPLAEQELRSAEAEKNAQEHDIGISVHDWEEKQNLQSEFDNIQSENIDTIDNDLALLQQNLANGTITQDDYNSEKIKLDAEKQIYIDKQARIGSKIAHIDNEITSRGHTQEIARLDTLQREITTLENEIGQEAELTNKQNIKKTDFDTKKQKYDASVTRWRVAQELQSRLQKKANDDQNKATESTPYSAPKNPMENLDMLIYFWNTVNGYEDISVDSYNFFRSIKDQRKEQNLGLEFTKRFEQMRS